MPSFARKEITKTDGVQLASTSWTVYPRKRTGGQDSDGEVTVTPRDASSVFVCKYRGNAGSTNANSPW